MRPLVRRRTGGGPSGFTVLIRDGGAFFCQQVMHRSPGPLSRRGYMVVNVFERFGEDGIANKVWRRLGFPTLPTPWGVQAVHAVDPIMPVSLVEPVSFETPQWEGDLRLIKFIRPMAVIVDALPYQEEYYGLRLIKEGPCDEDTGTLEILYQVTLRYLYVLRREL